MISYQEFELCPRGLLISQLSELFWNHVMGGSALLWTENEEVREWGQMSGTGAGMGIGTGTLASSAETVSISGRGGEPLLTFPGVRDSDSDRDSDIGSEKCDFDRDDRGIEASQVTPYCIMMGLTYCNLLYLNHMSFHSIPSHLTSVSVVSCGGGAALSVLPGDASIPGQSQPTHPRRQQSEHEYI
jgi:hypothetical protein